MRKEERMRQRSEGIWKEWKKLLRLIQVWIKLRLPLRKKHSIQILKGFLEASARPYMLRRTVKHFVQSVLLVQRAMRHQASVLRCLQRHVLEPLVWAAETRLLCDAFRIRQVDAMARIEAHFEQVRLKQWEKEVRLMWLDRAYAWREGKGRCRREDSEVGMWPDDLGMSVRYLIRFCILQYYRIYNDDIYIQIIEHRFWYMYTYIGAPASDARRMAYATRRRQGRGPVRCRRPWTSCSKGSRAIGRPSALGPARFRCHLLPKS